MTDPANIVFWLALIAIASVLQTTLLIGAAFFAWRTARQAQQAVERFEQQQLSPLMGRMHGAVDDVRAAVVRAREIEGEVRDKVRTSASRAANRIWPAIALGRAAHAAFSSFRRPAPEHPLPTLETTRRYQ